MKIKKSVIDNVMFHRLTFYSSKRVYILTTGWTLNKGDWWREDSTSNAKFFDIRKGEGKDHIRYGIYIARLCLVLMKGK